MFIEHLNAKMHLSLILPSLYIQCGLQKKKKKAQLSLFESAVDYICDMITTKQMLKGYGEGSFRGETGPSIQPLDKRERARNDSILTKIMQPSSSYVNAENEFSPHRKKKQKKRKQTQKEKEIHVNKWQLSGSDLMILKTRADQVTNE